MAQVKAAGHPQLTVETVIRSDGSLTLDDVYPPPGGWHSADIYNVEPAALGFYCLYRARDGEGAVPDCPMASAVAARHAQMLVEAGFDYIAVDITNWPQVNDATDVAVLRPLEVLFDEWLALRLAGMPTPQIAAWCSSPVASDNTTWQWLLDHVYNNATRAPLVWRRPSQPAADSKKSFFVTDNGFFNASVNALIEANGGRHDVEVLLMWALFGKHSYDTGSWAFFSPCTTAAGGYTTTMVGAAGDCDQLETVSAGGAVAEVSASGGYMLAQCALPWAAPGKLRGLTLQRLFKRVLAAGAPDLFMSSFNEHIGGRQAPSQTSRSAFNMGLPHDPQRLQVWVDTYAGEFSRDLEPSVEMGDAVWRVASSCVQLYKQGRDCSQNASAPCCTTEDKLVWNNVWSLRRGQEAPPAPHTPPDVKCAAGKHVDWVQTLEDNGSCDCASYCASNWANEARAQRPHWRGSTTLDANRSRLCRCIQATHWCNAAPGVSCARACEGAGLPTAADFCVPDVPPLPLAYFATSDAAEFARMRDSGNWSERCAGTSGSSIFCAGDADGRDGPFMLYSAADAVPASRPLLRCCNASAPGGGAAAGSGCAATFLSTDPACEGAGPVDARLGWVATSRGGETLRALRRCAVAGHPSARKHALDLGCDVLDLAAVPVLGFVR